MAGPKPKCGRCGGTGDCEVAEPLPGGAVRVTQRPCPDCRTPAAEPPPDAGEDDPDATTLE